MTRIHLPVLIWIAVFLAGIFLFLVFSVRNRLDSHREQDHFTQVIDYVEGSFVPQNDNINIIILTLKDPGLESKELFKFVLKDGEEIVRAVGFSGDNLGDPGDLRFQFEPIAKSQGRQLTLRVEREEEGPKVTVAVDKSNNLSFTAFYRVEDKMSSARSLVRRWVSFPTGDPVFFAAWVGILGIAVWRRVSQR